MEKVMKIFTQIVKSEVIGEMLSKEVDAQITTEMMKELYQISSKHDLAHIVATTLQKHNILGEDDLSKRYSQVLYMSVMRYENIQYELERICELFESEQIVHIPLKGAVMRGFYAEPWLRTSCDIDILIRPEDLDRACEVLQSCLKYTCEPCAYKDISLYAPSKVHLELHFMIQEDMENLDRVLCKVWEYVSPIKKDGYQYVMTPEFFFFHILAHMSYHFLCGGCGMRTFIDVWILSNKMEYDEVILRELCEEAHIWKFAQAVRRLTKIWFEGKTYDDFSRKLEYYVLSGGTYGTRNTTMTAQKTRTIGRVNFLMQRLFMPYRSLCILYPRLKGNRILYPYYTIARWCKVLQQDVFKRVVDEVKINGEIQTYQVDELKKIFEKLELKR